MKHKGKVLIVDDNADLIRGLKLFLSPHVESVITLRNPNQILETIRREAFDVILLDMNFSAGINSGNEGLYWMHRILELQPLVSVVLITAFGDVELAVKAMKDGAVDFIEKSWDEEKILSSVLSAITIGQSRREIQDLRQKQKHLNEGASREYVFCELVSSAMKNIMHMVAKVAPTDANVLITGENGTGKEIVAREIHRQSLRKDEIFISINLTAIPDTLFESELFGHVSGAFTDAREAKAGRFELAHHGTLFLDEIGNLPLSMQSKLLVVLQERIITRLGATSSVPVDFRLICATNMPLEKMVSEGTFRQDLLFRINTIVIEVPPLRERTDDIPSLAGFYLQHFSEKYSKKIKDIGDQSMQKLLNHVWPGNVRELQHAIEKAVIMSEGNSLTFFDDYSHNATPPAGFNLDDHEKELIRKALEKNKYNISTTAADLGINRSTLYEKIRKYKLRQI